MPNETRKGIVADRRLYLTRVRQGVAAAEPGQRVVEEGDPAAGYLLASVGDTIPAEQVDALGLVVVDGKVKQSAKSAPPSDDDAATARASKSAAKKSTRK